MNRFNAPPRTFPSRGRGSPHHRAFSRPAAAFGTRRQFPPRVRLSDRAFGWIESEIREWVATCISARTQSQGCAANMLDSDSIEGGVRTVHDLSLPGDGHDR
jgi:CP4-57 regulatory protein AlpA